MKILKTFAAIVPLLALGCVSATTHFGGRLSRLEKTADVYLKKDPRWATRFASEYTRFIASMPSHPSLDGLRVHALEKRAEAYVLAKREDLAAQDRSKAMQLKASSPYFLHAGTMPAAPLPGNPEAGPGGGEVAPGLPPGPGGQPPILRREPRVKIDLSLGAGFLTRQQVRSDEVNTPTDSINLKSDLGMDSVTGYPDITLMAKARRIKAWLGLDFRWIQFNGEQELTEPAYFDGFSYAAGQYVRSALRIASATAYIRFVPVKNLEGKIDLDLGFKHYYIETEIESSGFKHVDALNVPLIFAGVNVNQQVSRQVALGGKLKVGASFWAGSSFNMLALAFEGQAHAEFRLTDGFDLRFGMLYEQMGFYENKSHERRKEAGLGTLGLFAEAVLKF